MPSLASKCHLCLVPSSLPSHDRWFFNGQSGRTFGLEVLAQELTFSQVRGGGCLLDSPLFFNFLNITIL